VEASPNPLTPEEAALVFRRAAELQAAGINGDAPLLDVDTVQAIGQEAGLSPAAIHAAVDELRTGNPLGPADPQYDLIRSAVVPGPVADVNRAVDELARRNFLVPSRHHETVTVWTRQRSLGRAAMRWAGGHDRYPLGALRELRATITDHESRPGGVRVRLEGRFAYAWQVLPLRTQGLIAAGAGGVALLMSGAFHDQNNLTAYSLWAAGAGVTTTGLGLRSYSKVVARTDAALQVFLNRLVHFPSAAFS
jgi:hypothetical protein